MADRTSLDPADRWRVELEDAPPPKRGVPLWIWGCGGGCLLTLGGFILLTYLGFRSLYSAIGPEKAWPLLAEVLPYGDEPPEGYEAVVFDSELLADSRLVGWMLERAGPGAAGELPQEGHRVFAVTETFEEKRGAGTGSRLHLWSLPAGQDPAETEPPVVFDEARFLEKQDEETLEVTLQGRTLTARRYTAQGQTLPYAGEQAQEYLEVDLTGSRDRALLAKLISTGDQRADEEELERFLEPFDVWLEGGAPSTSETEPSPPEGEDG